MTEVYVLQEHFLHDGTYTEGVSLSLETALEWVAENPSDPDAPMYSQQSWRSYSRFTPIEEYDLTD